MKTHCKHGHEFTPENKMPNGTSFCCRTCARAKYVKKGRNIRPLDVRFWEKVDKTPGLGPQGECWEWTATIVGDGYGQIQNGAALRKGAHRVSYELSSGPIPPGLLVRHRCDNRKCVNPAHLELGTHKDNSQDMIKRGRSAAQQRTHCRQGHEYSPSNTYMEGNTRKCKACALEYQRSYQKKKRLCAAL